MAASPNITFDPSTGASPTSTVVTIGVFDGVHIGHRALIGAAVAEAQERGLRSLALTFSPHPREVLAKGEPLQYLSSVQERRALIHGIGADVVATLHFTREVAGLSAEEFMASLAQQTGAVSLWVGPDFALGRGRQGSVPVLREIGKRLGGTVQTVAPVRFDSTVVSSSAIRYLLLEGFITEANAMLGRAYDLEGTVEEGDKRGRVLGFPTANMALMPSRVVPANGVYLVRAHLARQALPGVANLGTRPSFGDHRPNLEVHLLDFAGDLYGRHLRVEFLERLRPEMRFTDVQELVAQMSRDVDAARAHFGLSGARE